MPADVLPETLILGGGIGGLSAALSLARRGAGVTVLERSMSFAEVGAGIQLAPNAIRILRQLDVLDEIMPNAVMPRRLVLAGPNSASCELTQRVALREPGADVPAARPGGVEIPLGGPGMGLACAPLAIRISTSTTHLLHKGCVIPGCPRALGRAAAGGPADRRGGWLGGARPGGPVRHLRSGGGVTFEVAGGPRAGGDRRAPPAACQRATVGMRRDRAEPGRSRCPRLPPP
jgi:hypothetical protein